MDIIAHDVREGREGKRERGRERGVREWKRGRERKQQGNIGRERG